MTVRHVYAAALGLCLGIPVASFGQESQPAEPRRLALSQIDPEQNQRTADAVAAAIRADAALRGFRVDIAAAAGTVELTGQVSDATQRAALLQCVRAVPGVVRVVDRVAIAGAEIIRTQAEGKKIPIPIPIVIDPLGKKPEVKVDDVIPEQKPDTPLPPVPVPIAPIPGAPIPPGSVVPLPPGGLPVPPGAGLPVPPGAGLQEPLPIFQAPGVAGGAGPMSQPPPMPPYAWPTFAPYNNYSRVAYPTLYPHDAWPYIGPFYPFPKVPLGWRSVSLTWQDGHWWYGRNATGHDWWRLRYR